MSSFATLQASRQKKNAKSFISSTNNPKSPTAAAHDQPALDPEHNDDAPPPPRIDTALYNLPPTVEVRSSNASGRGLWTKGVHKPGDVLISTTPHIAALSNQCLDSHCSTCFGPSPPGSGLKRCTVCRVVWYCDSTCQTRDWPLHKRECPALQEWAKAAPLEELSVPSDAVRCLGRMLWKKQRQQPGSAWTKEIEGMQSHRTSLQASAYELHTHLSHALVRYLGLSSPRELVEFGLSSASDLVDVISRFITNTFTVTTPTLTPIGASVSPVVALINHSCDPNAVVVFPRASASSLNNPVMQVVALRNLAPGEEILTAYIDTTLPKSSRQKSLQETYNFTCHCRLCDSSDWVDMRESMWCPKTCGGTCPVPTEDNSLSRCVKCKAVVKTTDSVLDALRIGQEALDKATDLQFKDPVKAKQLTTNLIPILTSAGLTPSSHPLLALSRLHQSLLISSLPSPLTQDALDDAIRAATRSSTGLSSVLQPGHPVRGIALAELGKILAVDEPQPRAPASAAEAALLYPPSGAARLKLAYETLLRAREELLVGFGVRNDGGQVGGEVRESLVGLERELGVWRQGVRNVVEDTPRVGGR